MGQDVRVRANMFAQRTVKAAHEVWCLRGTSGLIKHARVVLMHRAHEKLGASRARLAEAIETSGSTPLNSVTIDSENLDQGVHYAPTPRLVLDWVHDIFTFRLDEWCFIDVGAGRGRVVLGAAQRPYAQVIGVEFAEEFCEIARRNLQALPASALKAGRVELRNGDAALLDVPQLPCIAFLFNPFGPRVLESFIARMLQSHASVPRPIIFAYVNPIEASVFERFPELERAHLPRPTRIKFKLLSPYSLEIYATPEAKPYLANMF